MRFFVHKNILIDDKYETLCASTHFSHLLYELIFSSRNKIVQEVLPRSTLSFPTKNYKADFFSPQCVFFFKM